MKKQLLNTVILTFLAVGTMMAQKIVTVDSFEKVIVSPHVEVTFEKGENETVTIEDCTVSQDKVHIEVDGKTLRIYLEGAKEFTKNEDVIINGNKRRRSLYKGTVLTVSVSYKSLSDISLRGEETIVFASEFDQSDLNLKVYGESEVYFESLKLNKMKTTIYGESYLELKSGQIKDQKITAYGESKVNALAIDNSKTKLTVYGESDISLNVSELLKVTAYGEATIKYSGNAQIKKGLTIGGVKISQIDI